MNVMSPEPTVNRLSRIPKRIFHDFRIVRMITNWKEVLSAKLDGKAVNLLQFRNGAKIESPSQIDLQFLFHEVWVDNIYTPAGYKIKDGDTVLDIGANIGVFAVYAATAARNTQVLAFEPFPENVEYLQKNVQNSNLQNVKIFPQAVAKTNEERVLAVSESWIKHSLSKADSEQPGLRVQTISFDRIMNDIEKCDLLKIDCEGSEYEIFYSATPESLNKVRKIVGEYHQRDKETMNGEALCRFLEKHGFTITSFKVFEGDSGSFCATKSFN